MEEVVVAVSPQPQCLLLRLAMHYVELTYLKVNDNVTAHVLCQVSPLEPEPEDEGSFGVNTVHHITSEIPAKGS